ncbi:MAG: hypothetical protein CL624_13250 [Arcobacter sp.]|nr:hypothetical protein [Arcobacter sp.]|tara:strand:- start:11535 stop:11984 length:450 start_codon:yes stop_codon:yes gene_type:complete
MNNTNKHNTTRIKNFIKKEYIRVIIEKEDLSKSTRTNVLITKFFNNAFSHMHTDDNYKKKKFFFSYRNKYLNEFKKEKDALRNRMYLYKKTKIIQTFKDKFTIAQWEKISGDELVKYLALEGTIKATDKGLNLIRGVIKITHSKYKDKI